MTDQPDQTQPQYTEIIASAGEPTPPPPAFPFTATPAEPLADAPKAFTAPSTESVTEAITLLNDARERLAANSLSDVGYFIGRAITILGGPSDAGN